MEHDVQVLAPASAKTEPHILLARYVNLFTPTATRWKERIPVEEE